MIEIENLVKNFGDVLAVNGVSLIVPKGEFFAILGPNARDSIVMLSTGGF